MLRELLKLVVIHPPEYHTIAQQPLKERGQRLKGAPVGQIVVTDWRKDKGDVT